jgi:serine protease Do
MKTDRRQNGRLWPLATLLATLALGPLARAAETPAAPPAGPEAAPTAGVNEAFRRELRRTIGEARDKVFPALVSIEVVTVQFGQGKELKGQSVGSGTIFSREGHVLTNAHVTRGGRKFVCTLSDQSKVPALMVGEDPLTDLAVLKLDLPAAALAALPWAAFGDSDALEIGDYVMAMGSPFSLSRSVSLGIVSNTERVFPGGFSGGDGSDLELEAGQRTGLFTRWIQHDALISPGNSGGPLVNLGGEVVGVNELGGGNLSFAIPANLAAQVGRQLIAKGEVERSFLGVAFQPLGSDESLDKDGAASGPGGVRVAAVELDSPASRAGLLSGDILLAIDGREVAGRVPEDIPLLQGEIAGRPVGSILKLRLRRGGETVEALATTARLDKDIGEETSFHDWGITAQEITPKMARDLRLAGQEGALVTGVRRGGPAQIAEPPIEPGDVLREVGGQKIASLAELVAAYQKQSKPGGGSGDPLIFGFERLGNAQLTLLKPRADDQEDPPRELPRAWVGVATQPLLAELAEKLGLGTRRGFRITRVYAGSEALAAGLEVGDVILALDGEKLEPNALEDAGLLSRQVRSRSIGDQVTLTVRRGEKTLELPLKLERTRLTKEEARRHTDLDFELSVRELTFFDRDENRWPDDLQGVVVENVDGVGWAGLGGLRPADLIVEIGGEKVSSLAAFRQAMKKISAAKPERVEVLVRRGPRIYFHLLEPDWAPEAQEADKK